jgi:hypothetical protein
MAPKRITDIDAGLILGETLYSLVACTRCNGHLLALLWGTFFFEKQPSVVRPHPHLKQPRATLEVHMPQRG